MTYVRSLYLPEKNYQKEPIYNDRLFNVGVRKAEVIAKNKPEAVKILRKKYPRLMYISYRNKHNYMGQVVKEDREHRKMTILFIPDSELVW